MFQTLWLLFLFSKAWNIFFATTQVLTSLQFTEQKLSRDAEVKIQYIMESAFRPKCLDLDPSSPTAAKEFRHWKIILTNYLDDYKEKVPNKYRALLSCVSSTVFEYIEDCETFEAAIEKLEKIYVKTPNEIFARHLLATRKQKPGESLDDFLENWRNLKGIVASRITLLLIVGMKL